MVFYRVHHPNGLGLWYNSQGEFKNEIAKLDVSCRDLEMGHDEECAGGYLSSTVSVQALLQWFNKRELKALKERGYDLCMFESNDYRFCTKYKHWLFKESTAVLKAIIEL